ncbi:MAG: HAD family hydrolase [Patescibacteria group bacterium]
MPTNLKVIEKSIQGAIDRSSQNSAQFAVFDFDNTCIVNDIGDAMMEHLCRHELLRGEVLHRYQKLLEEKNIQDAYILCAQSLAGFTIEKIKSIVTTIIRDEHATTKLTAREEILALMDFLTEHGVANWIVSASPQVLVEQAMAEFGILGKLIGIRNRIQDGVISAKLEEPLPILSGKVNCIKASIDPVRRPILGVGDSMNDLAMLEYAEIKLVIDRNNELTELARSREWLIVS